MRINLIGNFNSKGLVQDANILRGILTHVYGEPQIRKVHHALPECQEAELNIFIEAVNPTLFSYAGKNVWIPNPEWTYKTWIPYISMMDEIWVKTKEAETIFREFSKNVKYIGWTSIDKVMSEKNYSKAIVLVGKNIYRNPKPVLQAYFELKDTEYYKDLPVLYIPHTQINIFCPPKILDKVVMLKELTETEYDDLLQECGLAICTSAAEGFGHAVNEAMSAGCNLLLSPIKPFRQLTTDSPAILWASVLNVIDHPDCLGTLTDVSTASVRDKLIQYTLYSTHKVFVSNLVRSLYEVHHKHFIRKIKTVLIPFPLYVPVLPKEEDLPNVSIVTLTRDRRVFMPLAKYSYMIQSYPEDKLEWVIVDDGNDLIEDELIGISNVKYIKLDTQISIGEKRNIGVSAASYDTIVMMDDDDVYPNNSVLQRVVMLLKEPAKECGFCTTIPCYEIQKFSSFMNVPPNTLSMGKRVSEATLVFKKSFWESKKFTHEMISEGDAFIHGREQMCRELSPQEIIVSLVHSKNTSSRKLPYMPEPNGCHYGFNEQLFMLVSEIGEALNTSDQKVIGVGDECA